MNQGRTPDVTEEDYSYITSQDLAEPSGGSGGPPEDDVLLVKYRGQTEEARFPAYSIGDGKLMVHDIRDRVGVMLDLPDSQARRIRLFYKGRQLKEPGALARDYGVKNMSEILAMVRQDPEDYRAEDDDGAAAAEDGSSQGGSSVGTDKSSKRRKARKPKKKAPQPTSPRPESTTSAGSPSSASNFPQRDAQLDKLDEVLAYYQTELEPLCLRFTSDPPRDKGKREDEHRRLSETVMLHVILKLDGVEPNGDEVVRSARKRLVKKMQGVLAGLDAANKGA